MTTNERERMDATLDYYKIAFVLACKSLLRYVPRGEYRFALLERVFETFSDEFLRECFDQLSWEFTQYGTSPSDNERAFMHLIESTVFAPVPTEEELEEDSKKFYEMLDELERIHQQRQRYGYVPIR